MADAQDNHGDGRAVPQAHDNERAAYDVLRSGWLKLATSGHLDLKRETARLVPSD